MRDSAGGYDALVSQLAGLIYSSSDTEGITISGGEPFLQAQKLTHLIRAVRLRRDIGVILYTGFSLEDPDFIKNGPAGANELIRCCDLIIDGQYKQSLDDDRFGIGSSNQKLNFITDRYREEAERYYSSQRARKAEIILSASQSIMVGVPSERTLELFNELTSGCTEDK